MEYVTGKVWFGLCNVTCLVPGFWLSKMTTFWVDRWKRAGMREESIGSDRRTGVGV